MNSSRASAGDVARASNLPLLQELLAPVPVLSLPYLGRHPTTPAVVKKNRKKITKTLARILEFAKVSRTFFVSASGR